MAQNKILRKVSALEENCRAYIYGAGGAGIKLLRLLESERKDIAILGFLDSFSSGELQGKSVYRFSDVQGNLDKAAVVVIASSYFEDIEKILRQAGLKKYIIWIEDRHDPECFSSYPNFLSISLNTRCNQRCFFCKNHAVETKKVLDAGPVLARLHKVIREAGIIDLTGWGEPFLIHKFDEVLRHLVDLNTFQRFLFITTNGSLLNARHAEILRGRINSFIVSFHAASEAMFNKIVTGTSFVKTLHSIEKFVKAVDEEDRRRITLHFVASTINYGEIVDYVKMASNIGVRNVRIGNVYTTRDNLGISLLSIKDAYNSVINEAEAVGKELGVGFAARKFGEKIKKSKYDYVRCSWPFDNCFIDMDGNLSVCCWISEQFGNIFDDDFESVWFGEKLAQLRRSRSGNQNCKKCNIHIPFDNVDSHLLAGT